MRLALQSASQVSTAGPRIAIIGLGFSGAAVAAALLSTMKDPLSLVLVDSNCSLGAGLAYGRAHAGELLNVRARDLSLLAKERGDFANWLAGSSLGAAQMTPVYLGQIFAPRALFGDYVRDRLFRAIRSRPDATVQLIQDEVIDIKGADQGAATLKFQQGPAIACDTVILATGYGTGANARRFGLCPFSRLEPERVKKAKRIVLVGSSLTMVDCLLRLRRDNQDAEITVISRRGLSPLPQLRFSPTPIEFSLPDELTTRRLFRWVRAACRDALDRGEEWQAVINGMRPHVQSIWQSLNLTEQRRFLRLARTMWDIHRHRIPADIHERVSIELALQRTRPLAGEVRNVSGESPFEVEVRIRGRRCVDHIAADLAFDCSGWKPDTRSPLMQNIVRRGIAEFDAHGIGLKVSSDGAAFNKNGSSSIFAVGPLGAGSLLEITGAPEIAAQASRLARRILH
jgi:uncharacterized NAD(P)/FAD-binding protein YdhS